MPRTMARCSRAQCHHPLTVYPLPSPTYSGCRLLQLCEGGSVGVPEHPRSSPVISSESGSQPQPDGGQPDETDLPGSTEGQKMLV